MHKWQQNEKWQSWRNQLLEIRYPSNVKVKNKRNTEKIKKKVKDESEREIDRIIDEVEIKLFSTVKQWKREINGG